MKSTCLWLSAILLLVPQLASAATADQPPPRLRWNAAELGATPDEKTDNTAAIQKTLDAAGKAGGGIVELPAGRYRLDGTLSIPAGVTLQGTYRVPPTAARKDEKPDGTVLLAYAGRGSEKGPAFIRLAGRNSNIAGLVVTYPEWKQSDVPPVPYPPCVESHDTENVGIQECCFLNPYEAIRLVRAARHLVRNITGYPSKRGIFVDECYDIGKIENIHFWPFGVAYNPNDPYCKWVNTQGVAFELARTDWHYVLNTFCFGYGVGYKFSESKTGSANGNFLGLGADSCRRAVLVEQCQPPGLLITNGEFVGRWESEDSVCIEIGPKVEGKVSLSNCSFWGPIERCVWMRSPFGQFTANACHFVHWDNNNKGFPAIQLDAGKAIINSSTFNKEGTHIQVNEKVRSAILSSNQAEGGFRADNRAGKHTQLIANEADSSDLSPEARAHYRLQIGALGDASFVQNFNGREPTGAADFPTRRWSTGSSRFTLPVLPNRPYTLTLNLSAPPAQALSPDAGLYLNNTRIAKFDPATHTLTVQLPPSQDNRISLDLRCKGWVPKATIPGSGDDRTLGISLHSLTMRAKDAPDKTFNANTGE